MYCMYRPKVWLRVRRLVLHCRPNSSWNKVEYIMAGEIFCSAFQIKKWNVCKSLFRSVFLMGMLTQWTLECQKRSSSSTNIRLLLTLWSAGFHDIRFTDALFCTFGHTFSFRLRTDVVNIGHLSGRCAVQMLVTPLHPLSTHTHIICLDGWESIETSGLALSHYATLLDRKILFILF